MTRHFSDPYVAAVFATVCSSTRGCTRAELLAENPEEAPGDFNNAIKELKATGAVDMLRGLFFEMGSEAPARSNAGAQVAEAATPGNQTSGVATPDASAPTPAKRGRPRKGNPDKGPLAAAFVADMRAMSGTNEATPQPQEKDTPMHTTVELTGRPRPIVLLALRDIGPTNIERVRARIRKALKAKAVANALYNLVRAGQVEMTGTGKLKTYRITRAGLKALDEVLTENTGDAAPNKAAKPAKRVAAAKAPPKRKAPPKAAKKALPLPVPATREPELLPRPVFAPEGFRCGLFSDGGLAIVAGDTEMQLDAVQTRALIGFLEHTTVLRAPA